MRCVAAVGLCVALCGAVDVLVAGLPGWALWGRVVRVGGLRA